MFRWVKVALGRRAGLPLPSQGDHGYSIQRLRWMPTDTGSYEQTRVNSRSFRPSTRWGRERGAINRSEVCCRSGTDRIERAVPAINRTGELMDGECCQPERTPVYSVHRFR